MHMTAQPDQSGSRKIILTEPGAPAGAPGGTGRAATGKGRGLGTLANWGSRWLCPALVSAPGSRNCQHFTLFSLGDDIGKKRGERLAARAGGWSRGGWLHGVGYRRGP